MGDELTSTRNSDTGGIDSCGATGDRQVVGNYGRKTWGTLSKGCPGNAHRC